ncbi:MAG: 2-amino-4-hydroxy-6-hydroxymethyldihydropteridine diphosphokinase [Candidatus Acididesulfobacter guangdongensis]|uniref:2-amino-4-hydroxy-6-hydroxymethyldihydropteridine diphosphokinase n=1 Tax=Acididesulfobacter guangdongensis TaxID=2597225 RepID=A0A519BEV4_ACIG2|nr:MAG: 2-amino-4-hydroxy-6-hydroxymethyldihydropteridine diphosphokinase [Candidatus Acididesulfobacter guangdongensis]
MDVYLGLGSNLGNKEVNLINAISLINLIKLNNGGVLKLIKASRVYKTSPVGFSEDECKKGVIPVFLNCVVLYKYENKIDNNCICSDYLTTGSSYSDAKPNQSALNLSNDYLTDSDCSDDNSWIIKSAEISELDDNDKIMTDYAHRDYENIGSDLLFKIKNIEKLIGRKFDYKNEGKDLFIKYRPREIDIDILLLDERIFSHPHPPVLNIPHKELKNRKFVLQPLLDIDENITDPLTKKLYKNILSDFIETEEGKSQFIEPYGVFSDNYLMINKI